MSETADALLALARHFDFKASVEQVCARAVTVWEHAAEAARDAAAGAGAEKTERILSAIFACNSADCPRPFALYRSQDVTGVSGEGTVAHGVQFADGQVVLRWLGEYASTVVWASLEAAMKVHGHDGRTRVVWVATDFSEMAKAEQEAAAAERARLLPRVEAAATTFVRPGNGPAQWDEVVVVPLDRLRELLGEES